MSDDFFAPVGPDPISDIATAATNRIAKALKYMPTADERCAIHGIIQEECLTFGDEIDRLKKIIASVETEDLKLIDSYFARVRSDALEMAEKVADDYRAEYTMPGPPGGPKEVTSLRAHAAMEIRDRVRALKDKPTILNDPPNPIKR